MSTHKRIDVICIAVTVLALIVTILFMNGSALGIGTVVDGDAEYNSGNAYFTDNDMNGSWDTGSASTITLNGNSASISGNGAYYNDGSVTIKNAGKYVISGELTDGSIIVDAYNSSKVWIMLDGVTIGCEDDACLIVDQADKVFLTLAEGSVNTLTSGSVYSSEALSDNTGGVIFSHDDLTINGSGTLNLTGSYKHGIDANDSLVITGGTINVTCPADGLHVNDEVNIMDADLTISAGDDGIHSDTSFYMASGSVTITDCYEGIEAVTIDVDGGDIALYSSDDGMNANGGSSEMAGGGFGGGHGDMGGGTDTADQDLAVSSQTDQAETASEETEESYIRINGGTVTVVNENGRDADGLDSNGSIYISGGTVLINLLGSNGNCALDYGSESGGELIVTGGTLVACGDSSMAEAFSEKCTQCAVLYNIEQTAEAGNAFTVTDASGSVIINHTPVTSYSSVAFSCADLVTGETYTAAAGDISEEFTMESTAMTLGSSSSMMGGMGQGGMGQGGMGQGGMGQGGMGQGGMEQGGMEQDDAAVEGTETADSSSSESAEDTGSEEGTETAGQGNFGEHHGGGHGRGPQGDSDMTSQDGGTPPEMPADGEMPEMPADGEMPEMPADGEMPEMPEGGEMPEMPTDGEMPAGGENAPGQQETAEDTSDEATVDTKTDVRDLSSETWTLLGASFLVLIAGIAVGKLYRKG